MRNLQLTHEQIELLLRALHIAENSCLNEIHQAQRIGQLLKENIYSDVRNSLNKSYQDFGNIADDISCSKFDV